MGLPENPITREEMYLSAIAGEERNIPDPITRVEQYLAYIAENGSGGGGGYGGKILGSYDTLEELEEAHPTGNKGDAYLVGTTSIHVYLWVDDEGWTDGGAFAAIVGPKGDDGEDGRGIVSITKTGTAGLVDTYTITYTDGTTSTFTVTNGSGGGGDPQVQADWDQTDSSKVDFIKNKPTALSDFTNDKEFIDKTVNNLLNYYLKSETYTQNQVNDLIAAVNQFNVEIVDILPTEDIDTHTIYFVPKETAGENDSYNEYLYINNEWELIGNTEIDLSQYYTKTATDTLLAGKQNKVIETTLADFDDAVADAEDGDLIIVEDEMSGYELAITEYSTTEQVIGKWINDKPIYRRVVTGNTSDTNNTWAYTDAIPNIDDVVNIYGILSAGDGTKWPLGAVRFNADFSKAPTSIVNITTQGHIGVLVSGTSWLSLPFTIAIEYTKTTD